MAEIKIRKNSWKGIGTEIWERLGNALKSPVFIAFFLIGIIAIGGIGVWLPAILDNELRLFESQNVFTYSVAILGTLCVESFFTSKNKSLAALGLISGVLVFLICCIGYYQEQKGVSGLLNLGAFLALLLFLLANVNDERFDDEEEDPKTDPTGYKKAEATLIKDKTNE